jgi:hypothetical protein
MMIRSLVIVTALCLFGTSASALTMQECKAKYKAAQGKGGVGLRAPVHGDQGFRLEVGLNWVSFQEKYCGTKAKAHAPKPTPAAPVKH